MREGPIGRRLRRSFAALVSLFLLSALGASGAEPVLSLRDGGRMREFTVALDEVYAPQLRARPFQPALRPVARQRHLGDLRAFVRQLRLETGETVDIVLYEAGRPRSDRSRRTLTSKALVLLEAPATANLEAMARSLGASGWRATGRPEYAVFLWDEPVEALEALPLARSLAGVRSAEMLLGRERERRFLPNDPLFNDQWHLRNTGQSGGFLTLDANLPEAWNIVQGQGQVIGVADDGVQLGHPDLSPAARFDLSWDFLRDGAHVDADLLEIPDAMEHGTAVAGVAAARGNNRIGGAGVAFMAQIASLRIVGGPMDAETEAAMFRFLPADFRVHNNSWGHPEPFYPMGPLEEAALREMSEQGRIFVFAAGNENESGSTANDEANVNSIYTIAVSSIGNTGDAPSYSERGACLIVSAPSNGGTAGITTTDITGDFGYNRSGTPDDYPDRSYTRHFGGTSAAAPLVSGVVALMLQANPALGWRDVQEILLRSARKVDLRDTVWYPNGAGFSFHPAHGAGMVNAHAAVLMAQNWTRLAAQSRIESSRTPAAPLNAAPVEVVFPITGTFRVEHATVEVNLTHPNLSNVSITLISPLGTQSVLHPQGAVGGVDLDWTFMTVWNWGESASGDWRLRIVNHDAGSPGAVQSAKLTLYGVGAGSGGNGGTLPPPLPPFTGDLRLPARGWSFSDLYNRPSRSRPIGMPRALVDGTSRLVPALERGTSLTVRNLKSPVQLQYWLGGWNPDAAAALRVEGKIGAQWVEVDRVAPVPSGGAHREVAVDPRVTELRFSHPAGAGVILLDEIALLEDPPPAPGGGGEEGGGTGWDAGRTDLGGGWRRLAWFGDYLPMGGEGWVWHNRHGFFYLPPDSAPDGFWMYADDLGWLWTGPAVYPFLYRARDEAWLWYSGSSAPRWFLDMGRQEWESHP